MSSKSFKFILTLSLIGLCQTTWALHPSVYEAVRRCAHVTANTPVVDEGHTEYSRFNHNFAVGNNEFKCLYIDSGSLKEGEEGIYCTNLSSQRTNFCSFNTRPSKFAAAYRAQMPTNYLSFMCGYGQFRFRKPLFCPN